ncbi:MAG TPA: hypothetical protein VME19_17245 [Streptosporangiaceae bacterium]|nr:hypothetical protein [Streptosporangiaceae bacterium]
MTNQSRIRGLAAAGLLCALLAGCGTAVATSTAASTPAATTPSASGAGGAALATAATETGCAGVSQATSAVVVRHLLVAEPVNGGGRLYTQRHASLVRALFGDFCAALDHPDVPQTPLHCPIDIGTSYTGTFYAGQRVLATFVYVPTGCPRLSLSASGKTKGTFMIGTASAAAPHLKHDLAAVLGVPESQVYGSATVGSGKSGV